MMFDIVYRDTARVVGSVGLNDRQMLRALEDRNARRESENDKVAANIHVEGRDGKVRDFTSMADAWAFVMQEIGGKQDLKTEAQARAGENPEGTGGSGAPKAWPDIAENPAGYAKANRLWRYDSWLHEIDHDKRSSFGDFRRLPYNYGVERVPVRVESVQGHVPKVQYAHVAFHTMTEAMSLEFSDYQDAIKWVIADAQANPRNVKEAESDAFESFMTGLLKSLIPQSK